MQINRISDNTFNPNFGATLKIDDSYNRLSPEKSSYFYSEFPKQTKDINGDVFVKMFPSGNCGFHFSNNGNDNGDWLSCGSFLESSNETSLKNLVNITRGLSIRDNAITKAKKVLSDLQTECKTAEQDSEDMFGTVYTKYGYNHPDMYKLIKKGSDSITTFLSNILIH